MLSESIKVQSHSDTLYVVIQLQKCSNLHIWKTMSVFYQWLNNPLHAIKSHHSAWQIYYFLSCLLCYSPFPHAAHPSSESCSRFSATLVRNSGVHTSWLYERLSCFRVGHLRLGSKAKAGPMSFRETSRFVIQFIRSKYGGKAVNRLLCKSR